jgi:hypothetical protein
VVVGRVEVVVEVVVEVEVEGGEGRGGDERG